MRRRQPEKILLSPEFTVLFAEPVEFSSLLADEETLVPEAGLTAAATLCSAVRRRRVLVWLVIDGQSGGQKVTPTALPTKAGELQS